MSDIIECLDGLTANQIIRRIAKTANGVPFYLQTSGLSGFCAEYQRIYDDFVGIGVAPSDAIAEAQNTMVCGLIEDGVWAKLDVFYVFAAHANGGGEALMNWYATGLFNAVAVSAPAFVALEGFSGDGIADFINTNWNPNTDGINYTLNDASCGIYIRTNVSEDVFDCGIRTGGDYTHINSRSAANQGTLRMNSAGFALGANLDSRGMWVATRTAINAMALYKNKGVIASDVDVSTVIPNLDFYVLAYNTGVAASFCSKQISMFFAGSGFIQADVDNMTDRFEAYMDSNGKGVIP